MLRFEAEVLGLGHVQHELGRGTAGREAADFGKRDFFVELVVVDEPHAFVAEVEVRGRNDELA